MKFVHRLIWCASQQQFVIHAQHIPGTSNNIADDLSNFQMQKFHSLAPNAQPEPTPCPQVLDLMLF